MLLSYRAGATLLTLAGPSDISRLPYHQSLSKTSGQASGTDSHTDPLPGHSSSKVVSQAPCLQSTNLIRGLAGGAGLGSQLSVSSNAPLPRLLATPQGAVPPHLPGASTLRSLHSHPPPAGPRPHAPAHVFSAADSKTISGKHNVSHSRMSFTPLSLQGPSSDLGSS